VKTFTGDSGKQWSYGPNVRKGDPRGMGAVFGEPRLDGDSDISLGPVRLGEIDGRDPEPLHGHADQNLEERPLR